MKTKHIFFPLFLISLTIIFAFSFSPKQTSTEPWNTSQLIAPADLARTINDTKDATPLIICVGPGGLIKGSLMIGPASDKANLDKLKEKLAILPTDAEIVIYCGCCPFEHCPNVRPAFSLLNEMHFTNHKLLNLEHNLKADWIDKSYPVNN